MSRPLIRRAAPLLAAVAIAAVFAPSAGAAGFSCGDTVGGNVTLTNDLVNCPGVGLIARQNTTLDLNGHKISGAPGSTRGVSHDYPAYTLKLKNGTISGFDYGAWSRGRFEEYTDLKLVDNDRGLGVDNDLFPVTVKNVTAQGGLVGVGVAGNPATLLGVRTRGPSQAGITAVGNQVKLTKSSAADSIQNIGVISTGPGGEISDVTTTDGLYGISLQNSFDVSVQRVKVTRPGADGVTISDSDNTLVEDTQVEDAKITGVVVDDLAVGTKLNRDTVRKSVGRGFWFKSPVNITYSFAIGNGGTGFWSVPGTSAASNVASGNALPQCVNVTCNAI
jgi:hypothetical protein